MKKQTHARTNYIPLLITAVTVMGSITAGVLTILASNKPLERDIAWLKDNAKDTKSKVENVIENTSELKAEIMKLKHSIDKTDDLSSDNFGEILGMLEKMGNKGNKKKDK